MKSKNMTSIKS